MQHISSSSGVLQKTGQDKCRGLVNNLRADTLWGTQNFSLMYEPTVRHPSTGLGQEKLLHEEHGICQEAPPPVKVLLATDSCRERQSRFLLRVKATYLRVYEQHIFCLMVLFLFFTHVMRIFLFRSEQVRCPFQLWTLLF